MTDILQIDSSKKQPYVKILDFLNDNSGKFKKGRADPEYTVIGLTASQFVDALCSKLEINTKQEKLTNYPEKIKFIKDNYNDDQKSVKIAFQKIYFQQIQNQQKLGKLKDNEYKEALDAYTIIRSYETDNKFTEDEISDLYINKYNKDLNIIQDSMQFFTGKETELKQYASTNKDKIKNEDKKIKQQQIEQQVLIESDDVKNLRLNKESQDQNLQNRKDQLIKDILNKHNLPNPNLQQFIQQQQKVPIFEILSKKGKQARKINKDNKLRIKDEQQTDKQKIPNEQQQKVSKITGLRVTELQCC